MKPHHWRATIFSCKFILSNFISFNFSYVLLLFNLWNDSRISFVIQGYIWWFEIILHNWLLRFLFIKMLDIHCVSLYGYIWWFGLNRISFVICANNGFIEWFNYFFKHSRTYIRVVWWELQCVLMNMRICCYDLVGVDSKTLVPFLLFYFTLFYVFFIYQNLLIFGT
jgi:hypothetical protein